ncbi:Na+/H+ antiporter [Flavobacterium silvaticum]|uniref:Na+/H+ antiporter n=1 Tax=Flavobacterium silvaticum TaxID=1852020 RepID=A0A972JH14_9FLAO|nr:Na+/H+ antiporter [Flavobacterium silvaticum]NMH29624.1 Na+/H+ antiporter [Flavobacterium silvaticum]
MLHNFPFFLILAIGIVFLIMIARKVNVAYPVVLVLAGLGVSFIPGIPKMTLDPELIFIIFLPPLLYEAAWSISWKELWRWRRIISSFAFVVVFFTAFSVALISNYIIPGFSLALGFLLGGIVSPPDAVSAGAIMKFVKVPKRMSSILEGESLLNDASSLIVFRFALVAVATGQFIWYKAALNFSWMVIGGIGVGLLIGFVFMKMHKYLPTDANIDTVLSLVTPYLIYIAAEEVGSSGVLAVVSGGLLLSNNRHKFMNSTSRLRGFNVWESLAFLMNGFVFMLIGLELPEIRTGLENEGVSLNSAIVYGLIVTGLLIVSRIFSFMCAVGVTLVARNYIEVADRNSPGIRGPFILGWAGMRGVVSLAAALSIPITLENGEVFPHRNLILFITFVVILLTLVTQGLTLPWIIGKLHVPDPDHTATKEEEEKLLNQQLSKYSLSYVQSHYADELKRQPIIKQMAIKWEAAASEDDALLNPECLKVYRAILAEQRKWLLDKNKQEVLLDEDMIRQHLHRIDLEEEKLRYA